MNKSKLGGLRRLVLDLLSCDNGFGIENRDKPKVWLKKHVFEVRQIVDQNGFGERKINVRKSTFQLH